MKREKKKPTTAFALGSFLLIIAVLVVLINLGVNTTVSIFIGAVVAVGIALALGISWDEIESTIKDSAGIDVLWHEVDLAFDFSSPGIYSIEHHLYFYRDFFWFCSDDGTCDGRNSDDNGFIDSISSRGGSFRSMAG